VVTCEDVHTLAGDAIDRELAPIFVEGFYRHLEQCLPCRRSFELERLMKNLVHTRVPRMSTPNEVQRHITESIENELRWWEYLRALFGMISVAGFFIFSAV
jgi:predicted anti-sigma-YlaC factor YlaD